LDSLRPEVRDYFTTGPCHAEIIHDPDQYSTDFGKAVKYIRSNPEAPKDTVVLGGIGGRLDQGLSQLHHLYLFQNEPGYPQGRLYLVSEESVTILLKTGTHRIIVRDYGEEWFGKHVGILPLQGPSRITTKGLEWDVTDWLTEFGGQVSTSNHVLPETNVVKVHTTRDVLFTIALKNHM
jgi:thiamine pyrophosphokinase